MEEITDVDYRYAKRIFKYFNNKNLGDYHGFYVRDYHDFYVRSDTLLLADVFQNFRKMCLKIYKLDSAHFLSLSGLAWQAALKKTRVKLELFNWYWYVINGRKRN